MIQTEHRGRKMSFEKAIREEVDSLGGWINAHAHIDRAYVMESKYVEHADMDPWEISNYPLPVKQSVTGNLHEGLAYTRESLKERMSRVLDRSIDVSVKKLYSAIDTTADIGLTALETALELKEEYSDRINFQVGSYPIFGFKIDEPERWDTFVEGSAMADFIVTLPERDDKDDHVGFKEHFRRVINLAKDLEKDVHFHVDQTNNPSENGTETLIEAVRWLKPKTNIWAVHSLSVASYNECRFRRIVEGLKETGIGIIVCPNATLSNKQNREVDVPMHNSITRVLDFILAGIPIRVGTDNIEDFFCPENTPDMFDEIRTAARSLRFFNTSTLAKLGAGIKMNEVDKMKIKKSM